MRRQYTLLKLLVNLIIFGFALSFEGVWPERTTLLVVLFAVFLMKSVCGLQENNVLYRGYTGIHHQRSPPWQGRQDKHDLKSYY